MSSINSVISGVDRDIGSIISRDLYKNKYAVVIEATGATSTQEGYRVLDRRTNEETEFKKSVNFPTSFQAATLVNKLAGSYTALREFVHAVTEDLYIDRNEAAALLSNIQKFTLKTSEVIQIMETDDLGNQKEIDQCLILFDKGCALCEETLSLAVDSLVMDEEYYRRESEKIQIRPFSSFVLKDDSFLLGNVLAIVVWYFWSFPWIYPVVLIYGSLAYDAHKLSRREEKREFHELAQRCKDQKMQFIEYLEKLKAIVAEQYESFP